VLDRRAYSARAPTLRILSPAEGAALPAGRIAVEWEGLGAGGAGLVYSVFTSAGEGATWQIRSLEQTTSRLELTVAAGPGPHRLRVLASDGARSAEATISFAVL
jgi:hypothetical protein